MKSRDLMNWSNPKILMVMGDIPIKDMGRMIDPYILFDDGVFFCFFKQNGMSFSKSKDLKHWEYKGCTDCGENVCVLKIDDEYLIFNSPENGIALLKTNDFSAFKQCPTTYLNQSNWIWAKDRITAGFVLEISDERRKYKYAMFFHGDNEEDYLFGASIGVAFSNDLVNWKYEI